MATDSKHIFLLFPFPTFNQFWVIKLLLFHPCQPVHWSQMRYNVCKWHYEFCSAYWLFRQPVHIRIHAQMHLAGTSLCQRCLLPDEIPSAPSKHHKVSAFRRTMQCFLSNIGKTVLIVKRKTCVLEIRHFKVNQILFLFQWFIDVFSPLPIIGHLLFHYNRYKIKK